MLLGIDVGTTKVAAALVDETKQGELVAAASHAHAADVSAIEGRSEQDPDALLAAAWRFVKELPAEARAEVRAIGVTGQMHGVVALDAKGETVSRLVTWQDGRCLEDEEFIPGLMRSTGHVLRTGYGCATLAWMASHGEVPEGAAS